MAVQDDPIGAEVRAIRDKLAAECGYDVEEILRRVRKRQAESGLEYVSPPAAGRGAPAGRGGATVGRRCAAGR